MFQRWWNVYFLMLAMKLSAHMFDSIVFLGASKIYQFWQWRGDCYCQLLLLLLRKPWSCDLATAVRLNILKQRKLQYISDTIANHCFPYRFQASDSLLNIQRRVMFWQNVYLSSYFAAGRVGPPLAKLTGCPPNNGPLTSANSHFAAEKGVKRPAHRGNHGQWSSDVFPSFSLSTPSLCLISVFPLSHMSRMSTKHSQVSLMS